MNRTSFLAAGVLWCSAAFAGSVTFQTSEVNVGQGAGQGLYGVLAAQWAAFNILGDGNALIYNDVNDTFDRIGISFALASQSAVTFIAPVNVLTVDYLVFAGHSITLTALDSGLNVLATFTDGGITTFDAAHLFNFSGIHELVMSGDQGLQSGVSDLIWRSQGASVPEPATWSLGSLALFAIAARRRLRSSKV